MVLQWLEIFEGTPGAMDGTAGGSRFARIHTRITEMVEDQTTKYLGKSKPHFVAFGVGCAALLGGLALWETSKGLVSYVLAGPLHLGTNLRNLGTWAVVTGGNTGIGRVYGLELASKGLNIILVGRNQESLEITAKEIQDIYHVQTKIIITDFADAKIENYLHVQAQLQGMDIGVLVNNAGIGPENPKQEFLESPPEAEKAIEQINVNVAAVVMMTRIILPQMVLAKKGCVINISSVNGDTPSPKAALYCATKAFIDFFTRALQDEYKDKGIIFQSVMPGPVLTKMVQDSEKDMFLCVTPEVFVPAALAQVGVRNRTYGHWKHALYMKRKHCITWFQSLF